MNLIKTKKIKRKIDEIDLVLNKLKERIINETIINNNNLESFRGLPIPYGAEIQILHKNSGLYLIGQKVILFRI